jgi:hypothetical protein
MTNKLDLQAIRKRAEAATEGNWYYTSLGSYYISPDIEDGVELGEAYSEADAEFIAHASQDVPALIAEVERLQATVREAISLLSDHTDEDMAVYEKLEEALK